MRRISFLSGTLLLLSFLSYGLDPPVKMWEKWYYTNHDGCHFRDMEMTDDGNLFITGSAWDWTQPILEYYCAFLLDLDGNIIWEVEQPWYVGKGNDGVVLPDSTFVITGRCVEAPDSTYSLFLMKISQEGSIEWTRIYDYPETREEGYGITCLPDGGFAVCGRVHGTGTINAGQMWLLRTDADGDTLWTREWGSLVENSPDWGKTVLFNNGEICVLAHGLTDSLPTYGPHLLFYDLEGNYLRGTDYGDVLYYLSAADMCLASDGGYTFTTKIFPPIWHTDQYGETLWWKSIYVTPGDQHEAFCLRQTFDSGYIFSGWDGYSEWDEDIGCIPDEEGLLQRSSPGQDAVDYQEGWLVRFDSEGNELWNINNTVSVDDHYYSCLQLPQGGYMACGTWGGSGYLVRYAPETGISSPDPASSLTLEVSPNPLNSVLSASFSLLEEGQATLTVYDLCGRTVGETTSGSYPGGTSTIEWAAPPDLGSGCYFVRLNTSEESVTRSCILIR